MGEANIIKQRQVKEGIDAVIVDSVLAIRKGLTGGQETNGGTGIGDLEKTVKAVVVEGGNRQGNGLAVVVAGSESDGGSVGGAAEL
jgi:glycerophosphodiester phosphodiesterase